MSRHSSKIHGRHTHGEVRHETCWRDRTWTNPTTGKPPFHVRLEQAGGITQRRLPLSYNTQKRVGVWHCVVFQTQEHPSTHTHPLHTPHLMLLPWGTNLVQVTSLLVFSLLGCQCTPPLSSSSMKCTGTSAAPWACHPPQGKISHLTTQIGRVSGSCNLRTILGMLGGTSTLSQSYKTKFHAINLYLPFIRQN